MSSDADYFSRLGRQVSRTQDELLAAGSARAGARARLFGGARASSVRVSVARAGGWWASVRWALVPAVALVALASWQVSSVARTTPLVFSVGAEPGQTGRVLSAGNEAALPLHFSDGSLLELKPHARSRVLAVEPNGARVELEKGTLRASVVHRSETAWTVVAGPFQVAVTGTKFTTRWDPQTRELEVSVQEGSVVVSGGTLREPERLSHGKALRVSQTSMNTQPVGAGGAVPASSAEPRQSPSPSAAPSHVEKPAAPHAEPFRAVFAAGSPTDLVTLSKELQKRGDLRGATRALMALRTRFPSDPRAVLAAQTLTELALARRDCDEARRWLGVYAASAPSGAAPPELSQRAKACGKAR